MATFTVGFMKPKEVVKMRSWPLGGELADDALGIRAFGFTFSTKVVSTLSPKCSTSTASRRDIMAMGPAVSRRPVPT